MSNCSVKCMATNRNSNQCVQCRSDWTTCIATSLSCVVSYECHSIPLQWGTVEERQKRRRTCRAHLIRFENGERERQWQRSQTDQMSYNYVKMHVFSLLVESMHMQLIRLRRASTTHGTWDTHEKRRNRNRNGRDQSRRLMTDLTRWVQACPMSITGAKVKAISLRDDAISFDFIDRRQLMMFTHAFMAISTLHTSFVGRHTFYVRLFLVSGTHYYIALR